MNIELQKSSSDTDLNTTATEGHSDCQLQLPILPKFDQIESKIESQASINNYALLQTLGRGYLSK